MTRWIRTTLVLWLVTLASGAALAHDSVNRTYTYDDAGRLVTATEGSTAVSFQYDAFGNLLSRNVPEPSALALGVAALASLALLRRSRKQR